MERVSSKLQMRAETAVPYLGCSFCTRIDRICSDNCPQRTRSKLQHHRPKTCPRHSYYTRSRPSPTTCPPRTRCTRPRSRSTTFRRRTWCKMPRRPPNKSRRHTPRSSKRPCSTRSSRPRSSYKPCCPRWMRTCPRRMLNRPWRRASCCSTRQSTICTRSPRPPNICLRCNSSIPWGRLASRGRPGSLSRRSGHRLARTCQQGNKCKYHRRGCTRCRRGWEGRASGAMGRLTRVWE